MTAVLRKGDGKQRAAWIKMSGRMLDAQLENRAVYRENEAQFNRLVFQAAADTIVEADPDDRADLAWAIWANLSVTDADLEVLANSSKGPK